MQTTSCFKDPILLLVFEIFNLQILLSKPIMSTDLQPLNSPLGMVENNILDQFKINIIVMSVFKLEKQ